MLLCLYTAAQTNAVFLKDASGTVAGTYDGIGAAYAAIPSTVTQAYLIELGPSYNGSLETFPISLTARAGTDNVNNITIRPAAGNTGCDTLFASVTGGTNAVINFNGATNVTIDGRPGGTGNTIGLAIVNTSVSTLSSPAVYFQGASRNNSVKYIYTRVTAVAAGTGKNMIINAPGISIENCVLQNCGLGTTGAGLSLNSAAQKVNVINTRIIDCGKGIIANGNDTVLISGCEIYHTASFAGVASAMGINPGFPGNWEISNNYIHDLKGTQAVIGLYITSAPTVGSVLNIYNNMIALDVNLNVSGANCFGLSLSYTSTTGHQPNIHFNTIKLSGTILPGSANVVASACIQKAAVAPTWSCTNNILVNECSGGAGQHVVLVSTATSANNIQDRNCYYAASGSLLRWATGLYTDLPSFNAAVPACDLHSISHAVSFASATDLHLAGASLGDISLAGAPVSLPWVTGSYTIATDFDGETRSAAKPYMGADEASVPLPVQFMDVRAVKNGAGTLVTWSTASEQNNYYFSVERSSDGIHFETISPRIKGAGNSTAINKYSYTDRQPATGSMSYYRIRQVDFDQHTSVSKTVSIYHAVKVDATARVFPNPLTAESKLSYTLQSDSKVLIVVYDILGMPVAVLRDEEAKSGSYEADIPQLQPGIYFVSIRSGAAQKTIRILKK